MQGRFRSLFITLAFVIFLCIAAGPAYAQGDLDNDGIPDNEDPETIVTLNSVLSAGEYQFEDLIVTNGSILVLESNVTFEGFKGTLIHAANIRIDTGSVISADAKGYLNGPGAGEAYSGGGYGGRGGDAGGYLGGASYGSALQPTDLGSGTIPNPSGSHGGGVIRLDVTDTLTVEGIISANGDNYVGPGGSGGSIYITAGQLAGSGTLQANGCPSQYAGYYASYGGGGGGRIAVYYNSSTFTGTSEAKGGSGSNGAPGEDGTVVFIDTTQNTLYPGHRFRFQENDGPFTFTTIQLTGSQSTVNGTLTITSDQIDVDQSSSFDLSTPGMVTVTTPDLQINGSSLLTLSGNESLHVDSIVLTNDATMTHIAEGRIDLTIPTLSIDTTSRISADAKGYLNGPGAGEAYSGGGYGGRGGDAGGYLGGASYGSALQPIDLGSGTSGSHGGGAIRLDVTDMLTVDGNLSANGDNYVGPGGSGGSIYLTAARFAGNGTLQANGCPSQYAGYYANYGGGGGGRIAVYYNSSSFTGTSEAKGGSGSNGASGDDGTVVFIDTTQNTLYPGHSFRFQENDGPFTFTTIQLTGSRSTVNGTLTITSDQIVVDQSSSFDLSTPGTVTITTPELRINGSSVLTLTGNESLQADSILLTNDATMTHIPEGRIDLTIPTISIDTSSRISADAKGYLNGPGAGEAYSGGGYGGRGGDAGGYLGGASYGSALQPTDLGSGTSGSHGGGAIRLDVTDTLTVEGIISANGDNYVGPGGSGGSIFLTASRFAGNGTLQANGCPSQYAGYYANYGGGGGGRIAVYYNSSTFTGTSEAKGGSGSNGAPGEDGTVVLTPLDESAPLTITSNVSTSHTESTFSETLKTQEVSLETTLASDQISGTISIPDLRFITLGTGIFSGEGFFQGNYAASLEGLPYQGEVRGVIFREKTGDRIHLKGTLQGDITGIVDGQLIESAEGSGAYDNATITWHFSRMNMEILSDTLTSGGTVTYGSSAEYPSTGLQALQTMVEGTSSGHYSGPMTVLLTEVMIDDPALPFDGSGFSIISYTSTEGSGSGWTCDQESGQNLTVMHGFVSSPVFGIIDGALDRSGPAPALSLTIERMDLGAPPAPDIAVMLLGPGGVSPGQTSDYVVEYRNDGLAAEDNMSIILRLSADARFLSASGNGRYSQALHEVYWDKSEIAARSQSYESARVVTNWGTPGPYSYTAFASEPEVQADPSVTGTYQVQNPDGEVKTALYSIFSSSQSAQMEVNFSIEPATVPVEPVFDFTEIGDDLEFTGTVTPENSQEKVTVWGRLSRLGRDLIEQWIPQIGQTRDAVRIDALISCLRAKDLISEQDAEELRKTNLGGYFIRVSSEAVGDHVLTGGDSVDAAAEGALNVVFSCGGHYGSGTLCNRMRLHDLEKCSCSGCPPCALASKTPEQLVNECLGQNSQASNSLETRVVVARDPNIKYGPEGHVLAGEMLDYRIEYENIGEGIAFGVYFIDTLDEDLDDSTLTIGPVYSTLDNTQIGPAGSYNRGTRTITWLVGEVGSHEGGYANISVRVRSDAPDDTEIVNYGIVYFPSVPEETKTNAIVSTVGINHAPETPGISFPSNGMTGVPNTTGISWNGQDPDGDVLRYDLYIGTTNPPPLAQQDVFDRTYHPENLGYLTTYYWRIVAKDPEGVEREGEVWHFTTGAEDAVTMISPDGGEEWQRGSTRTIQWSYSGEPGTTVLIELLNGTAVNRVIAANTSIGSGGSGSFNWTIPYNQTPGSDYLVRIASTGDHVLTDTSNASFSIGPGAPITVIDPDGSEQWKQGSTQTIRWNYSGDLVSPVKIEVIKGTIVRVIAPSVPIGSEGSGAFNFTFPFSAPLGSDYQIRVTSTSNTSITDTSDAPFSIVPPIAVVSPNGGEEWPQGSTQSIQWEYIGNPGPSVKIEALRGDTVLAVVSQGTAVGAGGSGSLALKVPKNAPLGSDFRIRISSLNNPLYADTSDASFKVIADTGSSLTLVTPHGNEHYVQGSPQTISWAYTGDPGPSVKIEALRGDTVLAVVTPNAPIGAAGSGSYNLTFPYSTPVGSNYRIRITSTSNPAWTDTSDLPFTIVPAITVISPDGGEEWQQGSNQSIRWTYSGDPGPAVKIEALRGDTVLAVVKPNAPIGTAGSGLYNLTFPGNTPVGNDYRIRVTSTSYPACTDMSDGMFAISAG